MVREKLFRNIKALLLAACIICMASGRAFSLDVYILSSSDIVPYNTCIEGIKEALEDFSLQRGTVSEDAEEGREKCKDIQKEGPKLIIAVGPQAAFALAQEPLQVPRLFCMILNPRKLFGQQESFPGISLNIPPRFQIQKIRETFAGRKKIGVFYNKEANQTVIDSLRSEAALAGMELAPFSIASANDIPSIINSKEFSVDVLLVIPDEKLGSTKIVEYLIKEALRRKIPVAGYNSWFAKNGAVLSFVIDYKGIGEQTGALAKKILAGSADASLGIMPAEKIKIYLDERTAEKLGVRLSPAGVQQADEVIR